MAAGQDSEAIIATLEEAKAKLGEAQRHTFTGLTRLGKIRSAIEFTLGRLGRGNPAITVLRDAEKSIKDRAVEINGLSARVDRAIAEIREAAGGVGGGVGTVSSPDPAPSDTVPVGLPRTYNVMAGNTPILAHNAGGMDGCGDAAYQGVLHVREEAAKEVAEGSARNHRFDMSDDHLADFLDGFAGRGDGATLKGGGVGWYDAERGVTVIQRGEYSMTAFRESAEAFANRKAR